MRVLYTKYGGQFLINLISCVREMEPEKVHQAMQLGAFYQQVLSRVKRALETHLLVFR